MGAGEPGRRPERKTKQGGADVDTFVSGGGGVHLKMTSVFSVKTEVE